MFEDYTHIGFSNDLANPRERLIYRFFEILPGFLVWSTLIGIFLFSWLAPVSIAFFIIFFDVYWILKTFYFSFHFRGSYAKMMENIKKDWIKELDKLPPAENWPASSANSAAFAGWHALYHLIILPMHQERFEIVDSTFAALTSLAYPKDKIIIVLAIEERAGESARQIASRIEKKYGREFFNFLITSHPDIKGELKGKGANETWAAKRAKEQIIDPLQIPYENIIVSVFDIDTKVAPQYFACLAYHFLTCENPTRSSFQPVAVYNNNIWDAPAFSRVIATSGTFWQMTQQERPERLVTFSSHSMSFKALVDLGYWSVKNVSEDSRVFWQALLHFDGDYQTVPIYYPVSMDANLAPNFWQTVANVYKQQRRWAWGSENIAFVLYGFLKNKKIPFGKKIIWSFHLIEGFWSWATNALILFFLGWLPLFLGGSDFNATILSYNLPRLTRDLMTVAAFGAVMSAIYSLKLLPPRPKCYKKIKYAGMVLQWLLLPITIIIFGSIPAIEAQTRLMLGKYMGFWVTEKHRVNN